jgi:hypothetical protein
MNELAYYGAAVFFWLCMMGLFIILALDIVFATLDLIKLIAIGIKTAFTHLGKIYRGRR